MKRKLLFESSKIECQIENQFCDISFNHDFYLEFPIKKDQETLKTRKKTRKGIQLKAKMLANPIRANPVRANPIRAELNLAASEEISRKLSYLKYDKKKFFLAAEAKTWKCIASSFSKNEIHFCNPNDEFRIEMPHKSKSVGSLSYSTSLQFLDACC